MYPLPAALHQHVKHFINDRKLVTDLVRAHGSPLNIVFPDIVEENIRSFTDAITQAGVPGAVYIAHKPNKSTALIRKAATTGACIDVASLGELQHALCAGFDGTRIEATGIKNRLFLHLAVLQNVTISVDSFDELEDLAAVATSLRRKSRILVRLGGFASTHTHISPKDSRFGISTEALPLLFSELRRHSEILTFVGFAYHLESNSDTERVVAVEATIQATLDALKIGLNPSVINIGGGFPVSLLQDASSWDTYVAALKLGVLGKHESLTWNGNGLGFRNERGTLAGSAQFREHYIKQPGAQSLAAFLSMPLPSFGNAQLSSVLADCLLTLYVEPGKAIFNQAGLTLARVVAVKSSMQSQQVVVADINKTNMNSAEIEHMVDPVVISAQTSRAGRAYIAGNLCSGSDILYKHMTFFESMPSKGDILAFPNTAAYVMDFSESRILQQPIAQKIAYWKTMDSYAWAEDAHYEV
jgi:diaminopimelate decarboxylase